MVPVCKNPPFYALQSGHTKDLSKYGAYWVTCQIICENIYLGAQLFPFHARAAFIFLNVSEWTSIQV